MTARHWTPNQRKGAAQIRDSRLIVRFTTEELEQIKAAAARQHKPVAVWARERLLGK